MTKQTITVAVKGQEIRFEPNIQTFNKLTNEMQPDDKVAPATNYLRRIVHADDKTALDEILMMPGAAMKIAQFVNAQYAPDLDLQLKN